MGNLVLFPPDYNTKLTPIDNTSLIKLLGVGDLCCNNIIFWGSHNFSRTTLNIRLQKSSKFGKDNISIGNYTLSYQIERTCSLNRTYCPSQMKLIDLSSIRGNKFSFPGNSTSPFYLPED